STIVTSTRMTVARTSPPKPVSTSKRIDVRAAISVGGGKKVARNTSVLLSSSQVLSRAIGPATYGHLAARDFHVTRRPRSWRIELHLEYGSRSPARALQTPCFHVAPDYARVEDQV